MGLWRTLDVLQWVLASWSWFGYWHWSLLYPCSEFSFSIWMLKVQRTSVSLKPWFWALEDSGGSWLGFGILILIWIWSLVFDIPMILIFALYIDFQGAKNIHVLKALILGFGQCWRFLSGVWHLDLVWIWSLNFDIPMIWLFIFILILKVQRTSMSFKSSFGALENVGGSWLGLCILILIWIWSLVFDIPLIQIFALYIDFGGAKTIHVL